MTDDKHSRVAQQFAVEFGFTGTRIPERLAAILRREYGERWWLYSGAAELQEQFEKLEEALSEIATFGVRYPLEPRAVLAAGIAKEALREGK